MARFPSEYTKGPFLQLITGGPCCGLSIGIPFLMSFEVRSSLVQPMGAGYLFSCIPRRWSKRKYLEEGQWWRVRDGCPWVERDDRFCFRYSPGLLPGQFPPFRHSQPIIPRIHRDHDNADSHHDLRAGAKQNFRRISAEVRECRHSLNSYSLGSRFVRIYRMPFYRLVSIG